MEYYGAHIFQAGFSSDSITLSQSPGPVFNREFKSLSPFPPRWIWRVRQHSLYPCTAQLQLYSLRFIPSVLPTCTVSKVSNVWARGGELGKNIYWEASDDSIFFSSVCFHLFFMDLLERIHFRSYLYGHITCFLALVPHLKWFIRTIQR